MQLYHQRSVLLPTENICKVTAIAWSPNSKRLALTTTERIVELFDSDGISKEEFPTKPAPDGKKTYNIKGLVFSPDSTKLAVAQSDNVVYIYKV